MKAMWFSVALCAAALCMFTASYYFRVQDQNRIEKLTRSTNSALCTFRDDLERRYISGARFLDDHPDGIPGISRNDIARSLANQKATLDALGSLACP